MSYKEKLYEILNSTKALDFLEENNLDAIRRKVELYSEKLFHTDKYGNQVNNISFWSMIEPCSTPYRIECWNSGKNELINLIETMIEDYEFMENDTKDNNNADIKKSNNKVFIVHGRDEDKLADVELFIRRIGLTPIILKEQASQGKSIIEKIEAYSDVEFAIVLYTSCDVGKYKDDDELSPRARQNVVFEHGYMVAHLKRENVVALIEQGVEIPGDWSGVVHISFTDKEWKQEVMKEMKAARLEFEWSKA